MCVYIFWCIKKLLIYIYQVGPICFFKNILFYKFSDLLNYHIGPKSRPKKYII